MVCMYVCMYACMYVCMHVYVHIHMHFHIHFNLPAYTRTPNNLRQVLNSPAMRDSTFLVDAPGTFDPIRSADAYRTRDY